MQHPKQKHEDVPTSNIPPIHEWAKHYWYTLRSAALQAGMVYVDAEGAVVDEEATALKAAQLIGFFRGMCAALPCPECREHYTADWEKYPFTSVQATDHVQAIIWLESLNERIELRKRKEREAEANKTGQTGRAAYVPHTKLHPRLRHAEDGDDAKEDARDVSLEEPPRGAIIAGSLQGHGGRKVLTGGSAIYRGSSHRGGGGVRAPGATGATGGGAADVLKRNLAIKSAVKQTSAGAAKGCRTCGNRKLKKSTTGARGV